MKAEVSPSICMDKAGPAVHVVTPFLDAHSGSPRRIATGERRRILTAATRSVPNSEAAATTEATAIAPQSTTRPAPAGPPAADVTWESVIASRPSPTPTPAAAQQRTTAPYSSASVATASWGFAPSAFKDAASYS